MDAWLDKIWSYIVQGVLGLKALADYCLAPLNSLGPVAAIAVLAFFTVALTKFLSAKVTTKRYRETRRNYLYWFNLRQEAMKCDDPEKAKLIAKNIDKSELNKAYYDFFFEGFLLSIATRYLPILLIAAYINEAYRPKMLRSLFGKDYLLRWNGGDGDPVVIGALFGYVAALILFYIGWAIMVKIISPGKKPSDE